MNHDSQFLCQTLLQHTHTWILILLCNERIDFLFLQRSENLDVTLCILVAGIHPELVEYVWRCIVAVEPDVTLLSFAKLGAVCLRNQRTSQCKTLVAIDAANQFRTRSDITPLICSSQLQLAVLMLIEIEEIVALQQLVSKFCE